MLNLQTHFEDKVNLWKERLSCCSAACTSGRRIWGRLSDGISSIKIDGERFCFPICFDQELQRKFSKLLLQQPNQYRPPHRIPLGLLMLSRGELTQQQLRHALEAQRSSSSGRIGEWMQKLGYVGEDQVTAALSVQWSCPVLRHLRAAPVSSSVPLRLLHTFEMVPVHFVPATRTLHMAFARNIEYRAILAIEQILECTAEPCLATSSAVRSILKQMEESHRGSDVELENATDTEQMCRITSSYSANLGAGEVRMARCGDYIWVRVRGKKDSANLIFSQTHSRSSASVLEAPEQRSMHTGA
jgi:Type II secretion system (T2SS), protein E, N-terminal domain